MPIQGAELDWHLDPLDALRRWPRGQRLLMLHSGQTHPAWSRYTFLALADGAYRFLQTSQTDEPGRGQWLGDPDACPAPAILGSHRPLHDLGALFQDRHALWIGYLGYDLGRYIEALPSRAAADRDWPVVQFERCPGWLVHDRLTGRWSACGTWRGGGIPDLPSLPVQAPRFSAETPRPQISQQAFEAGVRRVLDYIAAGDIFQANLTQRFTAACSGCPRGLYDVLAGNTPAWYGAYMELTGREDTGAEPRRTLACNSPELFFRLGRDRRVVTRPIKGTRPASVDPKQLWDSAKDAAELTMIVDLLRNDLGRVCDYGSVRVPEPRVIETHPTIHHTTATVTGTLHASKRLVDLLRAVMPGGSITGAPKVRAMQIIDELEPVRRGPYTGAIGYVHDGAACFNIAIRTMLIEADAGGVGRLDFGVGGGIVADSDPAAEYRETLDKAAAMRAAIRACAAEPRPTAPAR